MNNYFEIKPTYEIKELALLFKKNYKPMVLLLKKLSIPIKTIGRNKVIFLSDIKENCPQLFVSIITTIQLLEPNE